MKNKMTRNVILMAVVTVIMAVALSLYIQNTGTVPAADNAASLTDGTYTSSAQGCLSDVTVTHIQNTAPAPPAQIAVATPMIFPVATRDAVETISAPKEEIPFSVEGFSRITLKDSLIRRT